jgi:hypothetical protein
MRTADGAFCWVSVGQPRIAITALAITNSTAAHARIDPAVPKPAMYARLARTAFPISTAAPG